MNLKNITYLLTVLALTASSPAIANQPNIVEPVLVNLPSSPIVNSQTELMDDDPLSCKIDSFIQPQIASNQSNINTEDNILPKSLEYLNEIAQASYNTMRNGVIRYVTKKVALSLFDFTMDGFAAENIANYVSDGTKPYLPFVFANGVKITKVTPKGSTIIYRAEMPISKNHKLAKLLALAGKVSATTTICNDMEMVDDLLGRHIIIQYDYYDANGEFYSSFTING